MNEKQQYQGMNSTRLIAAERVSKIGNWLTKQGYQSNQTGLSSESENRVEILEMSKKLILT